MSCHPPEPPGLNDLDSLMCPFFPFGIVVSQTKGGIVELFHGFLKHSGRKRKEKRESPKFRGDNRKEM